MNEPRLQMYLDSLNADLISKDVYIKKLEEVVEAAIRVIDETESVGIGHQDLEIALKKLEKIK